MLKPASPAAPLCACGGGGGPERLRGGLVLRACLLLSALSVCAHLYLERAGGAGPGRGGGAGTPRRREAYARGGQTRREEKDRSLPRETEGRGEGRPHKKPLRWRIELEPWASEQQSLEDEARRFLRHITTPQVPCELLANGRPEQQGATLGPWAVCLDQSYSLGNRVHRGACRVYSLGLGMADRTLESFLARAGCEVHCFDPSLKQPHRQQEARLWLHRLSVDWRDPRPAARPPRQHAATKKMATILRDFGHREVDVLKADMESAEWKILENLVLEGVLDSVGQLLLEVHLHWAGFEVGGSEPAVVRYWFSVLRELQRANFRLFRSHSDPDKPRLFLHKNVLNASSTYTLGFVNTRWRP